MLSKFGRRMLVGLLLALVFMGGLGGFQQTASAAGPHSAVSPFSAGTCSGSTHSAIVVDSGWRTDALAFNEIKAQLIAIVDSSNHWCGLVASRATWHCLDSFSHCTANDSLCAITSVTRFQACKFFTPDFSLTTIDVQSPYSNTFPDRCEEAIADFNGGRLVAQTSPPWQC